MSSISDHDLERLAGLMMHGDDTDLWEIVRLLKMDDDICDARPKAHFTAPPCKPWNGYTPN
jgi:hypothetical protein